MSGKKTFLGGMKESLLEEWGGRLVDLGFRI